MKQFNATARRVLGVLAAVAVGTGASSTAHAGEEPALKVFVRWSAFTPQVLSSSASTTTRVLAARDRLQGQLQNVVPGSWVGRTFQQVGWSVIAVPASQKNTALAKLRAAFGASNVEAVHSRRLYRTPNDPSFGSQWWLNKIGAPAAWDTSTGSSSVVVAVVDTGASLSHPDLTANLWVNPSDGSRGYNAISPGFPPEDDDFEGHGTHVSGIIGAQGNNARQVTGVNWNVKILPIKVFDDSGATDDPTIVQGLDYVLNLKSQGVNIRATNDSWGGPETSQVLQDAFARLDTAGILNFVAAGNGDANNVGYSIDNRADYPSSYSYPTIVSVASSNENDGRVGFSNYGANTVDIFAPGTDILSLAATSQTGYPDGTQYLDGTSMSTPIVTGAAALLWSINSSLSATQMKALLLNSSYKAPSLNGLCVSNGRLDLANAVASIATTTPTPTFTPTPTATATPTPTATATPKPTATATPRPTATPTPRPTATATPRPTATTTPKPTATATPKPTATPTPKPTATATPRPTATPLPTATPKPTATPSPTATPAPTGPFTLYGYAYYKENGVSYPIVGVGIYLDGRPITSTNGAGMYTIKGLFAQKYLVGARLAGYSFEGAYVTFSGTGTTSRRDLLGMAPSVRYSISGTVKNANGQVLRGIPVQINNLATAVASTNAAGRFTIVDRPQNTYIVSATINGTLVAVRIAVPTTTGAAAPNADIVLQPKSTAPADPQPTATPKPTAAPTPQPTATPAPTPTGSFVLSGYTYYVENGVARPVAGVGVYLDGRFVTTSNTGGIYSIQGVSAGTHTISALLTGYSFQSTSVTFSGSSGATRRDLLGVAPSVRYSISGTVKNANGQVLRGMQILLNNQPISVASTNTEGRFVLNDRPKGTYTLSTTINGVVVSSAVTLPMTAGTVVPNADILLQPRTTSSIPSLSSSSVQWF